MKNSIYAGWFLLVALFSFTGELTGQELDENCIVSILNRSARVKADGTWQIDNVPANFGPVRVRATCVKNGVTMSGQSDFINLEANIANGFSPFELGNVAQIPTKLTLTGSSSALTEPDALAQLAVTAAYPDGSTGNVTSASTGTVYTISNPLIATVSQEGLVTAHASGTIIISASNEGAVGIVQLKVMFSGTDSDGDGIPDDIELANGLNPNDPVDAREDPDGDGLTNFDELITHGSDRLLADTDGDGINDGDEVAGDLGKVTSPLLADSDGDGIRDLLELQTGSDPTDAASFNLAQALDTLEVTPASFVLTVNTILGEASRQLAVTGQLKDGTTIDLTSTARGTSYGSSDLFVVNFGTPDGRVFASQDGAATVTVTNVGFSQDVSITVRSTSPAALGFVTVPGYANGVAVNGDYAYVAAGASGLQIVDVTDRRNPVVAGALDTPGNANEVRVVGNLAYVADGDSGLRIVNVSNPAAPVSLGFVDTPGVAWDVAVAGNRAYVADGGSGLQVIDVTNPASPTIIGSIDTLGTAKGVDVLGGRAVVADGSTGLQVLDVSDATRPNIVGSLSYGGDARDVVLNGNFAFVADFETSFTSIDISDPTRPVRSGSTPLDTGGRLQGVAVAGRFALGADVLFVNGVPIIDIGQPAAPTPRSILDFSGFRDDDGQGIAVDSSYVYLAAVSGGAFTENGTTGDSRLYIGQYQSIEDTRGIAPLVAITSPVAGATVVEGETITVNVDASDDVEVASVSLSSNGSLVGSDTVAPYQFGFTVPTGIFAVNLVAQAIDFGANTKTSAPVLIQVVPDPGTTVTGRVVTLATEPVSGAQVAVFGGASVTTGSDGTFSLSNVPTIRGNIVVAASAEVEGVLLGGSSVGVPAVRGGVTDVGDIVVSEANFETQYGASLAQCDDCWVEVDLPFPFTYFGVTYQRAFFDGNGRVGFDFGSGDYTESIAELSQQPIVSALWNDWDARGVPGSGIYYNGGLPGRAVFTWLDIPEYPSGNNKPRVTFQTILFQDGRIQFGYNGVPVRNGVTGISAGPGSVTQVVDFSNLTDFSFSGATTLAEQFNGNFDLDHNFVTWTPDGANGFGVRVFAQPGTPPTDPPSDESGAAALLTAESPPAPKVPSIMFHSRLGRVYLIQCNESPEDMGGRWLTVGNAVVGDGDEMKIYLPDNVGHYVYRVIPAAGGVRQPSELQALDEWSHSLRISQVEQSAGASKRGGVNVAGAARGTSLSFATTAGCLYRIECSEDLKKWHVIGDTFTGNGGLMSFDEPPKEGRASCFYRVVRVGATPQ